MLEQISSEHILSVIATFYNVNCGDDATTDIILNIGSEILDISPDTILEK